MMRSAKAGNKTAQRFRDAALPWLDDAYAFAQVLMRTEADAEQAVQDCYLRALCQFDGFRGTAIRPWLLAILKTVCQEKLGEMLVRRGSASDAGASGAPERRDCFSWQTVLRIASSHGLTAVPRKPSNWRSARR